MQRDHPVMEHRGERGKYNNPVILNKKKTWRIRRQVWKTGNRCYLLNCCSQTCFDIRLCLQDIRAAFKLNGSQDVSSGLGSEQSYRCLVECSSSDVNRTLVSEVVEKDEESPQTSLLPDSSSDFDEASASTSSCSDKEEIIVSESKPRSFSSRLAVCFGWISPTFLPVNLLMNIEIFHRLFRWDNQKFTQKVNAPSLQKTISFRPWWAHDFTSVFRYSLKWWKFAHKWMFINPVILWCVHAGKWKVLFKIFVTTFFYSLGQKK